VGPFLWPGAPRLKRHTRHRGRCGPCACCCRGSIRASSTTSTVDCDRGIGAACGHVGPGVRARTAAPCCLPRRASTHERRPWQDCERHQLQDGSSAYACACGHTCLCAGVGPCHPLCACPFACACACPFACACTSCCIGGHVDVGARDQEGDGTCGSRSACCTACVATSPCGNECGCVHDGRAARWRPAGTGAGSASTTLASPAFSSCPCACATGLGPPHVCHCVTPVADVCNVATRDDDDDDDGGGSGRCA
jgi:hypothetical protein